MMWTAVLSDILVYKSIKSVSASLFGGHSGEAHESAALARYCRDGGRDQGKFEVRDWDDGKEVKGTGKISDERG